MVELTNQSPYKIYRHFPNSIQEIPSYSNGFRVQINNQQQNLNQLQFKRERQRRVMIDKIITLFDEDGSFISLDF